MTKELDVLKEIIIKPYIEDIKFLLKFIPPWAKEAPPGLCPTMYGTLTQEGDQKIIDKINIIREKIK